MSIEKVPFLDLRVVDEEERLELLDAVDRVLRHGRIVLGPEVEEFERKIAERVGRRFAVGVNSGSDALVIAMRALEIGAGDEVIMPALSFVASANAVAIVGGTPVFADLAVDLNADADSIETLVSPATRVIMPVHWAGRVGNMDRIQAIADRHGLAVVEDASQAFDASWRGRKAGSFGTIGCFSMNSMKVFASIGEAGVMVMDDPALYEKCQALRYHGVVNKEYAVSLSQNARLHTIQAAALLVRLKRLDALIAKRREHAGYYNKRLSNVVTVPTEAPNERHVYYTYTIQADRRDELKAHLEASGIEVKIQHSLLMPQHPLHAPSAKGIWSNADRLIKGVLCLPANEKITVEQRARVADAVLAFAGNAQDNQ